MVNVSKVRQVYKCDVCGNIVEILTVGGGELVCCGKVMELMVEKTEDQGKEKHVPVLEKTADGVKVKVGTVEHPMEDTHFIEWVEVVAGDKIYRQWLSPGQKPEVFFNVVDVIQVRAYCNVHGLWRG